MKVLVIEAALEILESVSLTFYMSWPDIEIIHAPDGETGIYLSDAETPDMVILDIGLPDVDGFTVGKEIRRFSDVPIIILTARDDKDDIVRGLDVGADDYIIYPFRPLEFIARVKAVQRRRLQPTTVVQNKVLDHGGLRLDPASTKVTLGERSVHLTGTEYRLLYHLMKNAGKIVPRRTLLSVVWGPEFREETKYLKVHIRHLREKLQDDTNNPRYILTDPTVGYGFAKTLAR
jgi:two-component system KDP operon response regulator KdpE